MLVMNSAAESKAPLLSNAVSSNDLAEATGSLFDMGVVLRLKPNETLFSEGDEAGYVYRIGEGVVRSFKMLIDGRRQIISFGQPGDFYGLGWTSDWAMTVEAITDVVVVSYSRRHIEQRASEGSDVRKRMMAFLFEGLCNAQEHLVMLGRQTAIEKLAWFLVRMARPSEVSQGVVDIPMNRTDIADYLGVSMETVSRGFSLLKRDGYIALPNAHQVCVRSFKRLDALARGSMEP